MLIFFDLSCLTRGKTLLCRNILTSALSTFLTIVLFGVWQEEGISTARFRFSPEEKPKIQIQIDMLILRLNPYLTNVLFLEIAN